MPTERVASKRLTMNDMTLLNNAAARCREWENRLMNQVRSTSDSSRYVIAYFSKMRQAFVTAVDLQRASAEVIDSARRILR